MYNRVYIAGPLFTEQQTQTIKNVEKMLDDAEQLYFSPREFGVIANEPMSKERMKRIFDMNIHMLDQCELLIAIIDDRDSGTIFELGHFYQKTKFFLGDQETPRIITYSGQGHGVNVMLKHAIFTHATTIDDLELAYRGHELEELEVLE